MTRKIELQTADRDKRVLGTSRLALAFIRRVRERTGASAAEARRILIKHIGVGRRRAAT